MFSTGFSSSPYRQSLKFDSSNLRDNLYSNENGSKRISNGFRSESFDERPILGRHSSTERDDPYFSPMNSDHRTPVQNRSLSPHRSQTDLRKTSRESPSKRSLHNETEMIIANDYSQPMFHAPSTRKVIKVPSKENHSLTNGRAKPVRSVSATTITYENKEAEPQRPKPIRRLPLGHLQRGAGLITPESWKTDPVTIKSQPKKKPEIKAPSQPTKPERQTRVIAEKEQNDLPKNKTEPKTLKRPKSKEQVEQKEEKAPEKRSRSKDEKEVLKSYIDAKKQKNEQKLLEEKQMKIEFEKQRREKLKQLSEHTKTAVQQSIPVAPVGQKRRAPAESSNVDKSEEKRKRMLDILGPGQVAEPPRERHMNTPFEEPIVTRERSSSSSSSSRSSSASSHSVVELQKARPPPVIPIVNAEVQEQVEDRQKKLLRWAMNLSRDCNVIEDKIKYSRPDGTQRFDIVPPTKTQLRDEVGNLRTQSPIKFVKEPVEVKQKSKDIILRPSGRLSLLNRKPIDEYEDVDLPGIGNLRNPDLRELVKRDYAATKIQAVFRGYRVRKAVDWINPPKIRETEERTTKLKAPLKKRNRFETPAEPLELRLTDDPFTIGSTLLRNLQRHGNIREAPRIIERSNNQEVQQKEYEDDFSNVSHSRSAKTSSKSDEVDDRQKRSSPLVAQEDFRRRTSKENSILSDRKESEKKSMKNDSSSDLSDEPTSSVSIHPATGPKQSIFSPRNGTERRTSASSVSTESITTPRAGTPVDRGSPIPSRRSVSPPMTPVMSFDNGRPIRFSPVDFVPKNEERRYSPNALERQMFAELNLLDGVDASIKQIENMERLRSVTSAQQEVVSLAQILKNKNEPTAFRPVPKKAIASSESLSSTESSLTAPRKHSSSNSSTTQTKTREDLKILESRLKNLENKLDSLVDRGESKRKTFLESETSFEKEKPVKQVERRKPSKPTRNETVSEKSSGESSIAEDLPISHRSSSSTISTIQRKTLDERSEIPTEIGTKDDEYLTASFEQPSESQTTDISELKQRVQSLEKKSNENQKKIGEINKRNEKNQLKQREEQLKQKLKEEDEKLRKLENQTRENIQKVPQRPTKKEESISEISFESSESTDDTVTTGKNNLDATIPEDLPNTSLTSQSKSLLEEAPKKSDRDFFEDDEEDKNKKKTIQKITVPSPTDVRNFFDDDEEEERPKKNVSPPKKPLKRIDDLLKDDDNDDEESSTGKVPKFSEVKKEVQPLETPREISTASIVSEIERSSATDQSSQKSNDSSKNKKRRSSNHNISPLPERLDSNSSSSSSSEKSDSPAKSKSSTEKRNSSEEKNAKQTDGDYFDDFTESANSSSTPKKPIPQVSIQIENESIHEDISDGKRLHEDSSSASSEKKSSQILVLNKVSAPNTPRQNLETDSPIPQPPTPLTPIGNQEQTPNDDTSLDVTEDEDEDEQDEERVDKIAESLIFNVIDRAIDKGRQIGQLKNEKLNDKRAHTTKDAREWISDGETSSESDPTDVVNSQQQPNDRVNSKSPETPPVIPHNDPFQADDLIIDLSDIDSVPSPSAGTARSVPVVQTPQIQILVPYSKTEVTQLCDRALQLLLDRDTEDDSRSQQPFDLPDEFFILNEAKDETERTNQRAFGRLVFDLSAELVNELSSENVTQVQYPQWQRPKLIPKRYSQTLIPKTRQEKDTFIKKRVLELLRLDSRPPNQPKYRIRKNRQSDTERFESVLDDEIRRTESQWTDYDTDRLQVQFNTADSIFEDLFDETIAQCVTILQRRFQQNNSSTRL